ncbi:MAG TPA: FAD binding domain-containing protein, partial [Bacteroidales bacterium]|nr:FAD binding domain-containing protein [Bacteroidales bacterium]
LAAVLRDKDINDPVGWLVRQKYLPDYFLTIPLKLVEIFNNDPPSQESGFKIGGATDLMVQKAEALAEAAVASLNYREDLKGINIKDGRCYIGAATTMSELEGSPALRKLIPEISSYLKLVASESVRNMATVAGNIVNASPIGDITIMLLALNAELIIGENGSERRVMLKDFYKGYKNTDLSGSEIIKHVVFDYEPEPALFSFEKVSKRTQLDIASVNSAMLITMGNGKVSECYVSAGGVSPIPLLLRKTSQFLKGKSITPDIIMKASIIMQDEISPISDVRGSAEYKRLLLRQLLLAHFIRLFPENMNLTIDLL